MQEENMKYSLVSNMKYVCGVADKANKKLRLYMICNFIASLLRPILESFIVSSVVFVLTNHISIEKFLLVLLLLVLLSIILDFRSGCFRIGVITFKPKACDCFVKDSFSANI